MSLDNHVGRFNDLGDGFSPQLERVRVDVDEAEERLSLLVGEVLVKIGGHMQLLKFEQLELAKEKSALKNQIVQLRMVHVAERAAVIESARTHMRRVSEKVKLVVDYLVAVDERINTLSADLVRFPTGYSFHLKGGCLSFHTTYKEMLKINFSAWLENLSEDHYRGIENYPEYKKKEVTQLATINETATSREIALMTGTNQIVAKFAEPQIKKLKILETETIAMRALNTDLEEEKESMAKEHKAHIDALKYIIKIFQPDEILKGLHELMTPFEEISKGKLPKKSIQLHELYMKHYPDWKNNIPDEFFKGYRFEASYFCQKVKPIIAAAEAFQRDFDISKIAEAK